MKLSHETIQSGTALLAVFASIVAVVFTWQQVEMSRRHTRLSVTPILQITPYLEGKGGRNGLYLTNDGLGPAIIKGFSIKSGNIVASGFESDRWSEILRTASINPACFGTGWPKIESTIRPGVEIPLVFATKAPGTEVCLVEVVKLIGGNPIEINVEYESIYSEPKHLGASSRIYSSTVDALYRSLTEK